MADSLDVSAHGVLLEERCGRVPVRTYFDLKNCAVLI